MEMYLTNTVYKENRYHLYPKSLSTNIKNKC